MSSSSGRKLRAKTNISDNNNVETAPLIGDGYSVRTSSGFKHIQGANVEESNGKTPNVWAQGHPLFFNARNPLAAHPEIFADKFRSAAIMTLPATGTEVAKLQDPYTEQTK